MTAVVSSTGSNGMGSSGSKNCRPDGLAHSRRRAFAHWQSSGTSSFCFSGTYIKTAQVDVQLTAVNSPPTALRG